MDYRTFKNEISNLKAYTRAARELECEIDALWYELSGVKGIQFDKLPISYNPELNESYRLDLIDEIETKQKELDFTLLAIERYKDELERLPDDIKDVVVQIFINGHTFAEIGQKVGFSDRGLHYRVKREIEKL